MAWSQPAPRSSGIRFVVDHFPKNCGPPEYHPRSIKRFKRRGGEAARPFRGGLVFKAHRLVYHSTLGLRVIKKKKKKHDHLRECVDGARHLDVTLASETRPEPFGRRCLLILQPVGCRVQGLSHPVGISQPGGFQSTEFSRLSENPHANFRGGW